MKKSDMDSRLIPFEIDDVIAEAQSCNHWFVDLVRVMDDAIVMVNLSEWQIRAFCVLVKRKKVGFEEYILREWCDGRTQELHFNENGTIQEDFLSSVLMVNSNLMFEIL